MYNRQNLQFIEFLKKRLSAELPGSDAQVKLAPALGNELFRQMKASQGARHSAVLLLLREVSGEIKVVFTLRSAALKNHSGQISFPGGKCDKGETYVETALRETHEEMGIEPGKIEIVGGLTELFVPPSNSLIHPFVGITSFSGEFRINPDEVEEAFEYPLVKFTEENFLRKEEMYFKGTGGVMVPYWEIHPKTKLWGATSMILSEFVEIYKEWKEETVD